MSVLEAVRSPFLAVSSGKYDVQRVRADFPILQQRVYGKPLIYLDNANTTQKPTVEIGRAHV